MPVFRKIKHCRICNNKNLKEVINLGVNIYKDLYKKNLPKPYDKKIPLKTRLRSKYFGYNYYTQQIKKYFIEIIGMSLELIKL